MNDPFCPPMSVPRIVARTRVGTCWLAGFRRAPRCSPRISDSVGARRPAVDKTRFRLQKCPLAHAWVVGVDRRIGRSRKPPRRTDDDGRKSTLDAPGRNICPGGWGEKRRKLVFGNVPPLHHLCRPLYYCTHFRFPKCVQQGRGYCWAIFFFPNIHKQKCPMS